MHIGLQIPSFKYPGGTAAIRPKLKEIVTTAEEAGFYSLWVMDHFYQIKGMFGEAYTDPMLESYATLGYIAALTGKAYLGVLVTGVIYRYPSVLMKMVNTVDILSGGRTYFGIGAGWYEDEAIGYGIPYPSTSERFEQLEDNLKLAKALWASDETSFEGKHFSAPAQARTRHCEWSLNMRIPAISVIGSVQKTCKKRSTPSKSIVRLWDAITIRSRKHPSAPCIFPGMIR
jgi:alkanesulfonate monooxygenase SsuD/methylene tetrahydromethanopterin reductase-like flavin-dependent oxidoreductase (luciferase family)